jgi:carbon-monoxide dehydrogenase iron sulfur subunit
MGSGILSINLERCTGCRNCELACSVAHYNTFNPSRSRIHILKKEAENQIIPVVCLQCEEPLCVEACPTVAIRKNEKGILFVNKDDCIGCQNCITACIYGGIALDPITRKAIKCDLCGGDPKCVSACEYGAIQYTPLEPEGLRNRKKGFEVLARKYQVIKEEA